MSEQYFQLKQCLPELESTFVNIFCLTPAEDRRERRMVKLLRDPDLVTEKDQEKHT